MRPQDKEVQIILKRYLHVLTQIDISSIIKERKKGGETMENLAKRMVRYRAKESISMKELARRCNVTLQTIHNIETGIQDPSRVTKEKIEMVIGEEE